MLQYILKLKIKKQEVWISTLQIKKIIPGTNPEEIEIYLVDGEIFHVPVGPNDPRCNQQALEWAKKSLINK